MSPDSGSRREKPHPRLPGMARETISAALRAQAAGMAGREPPLQRGGVQPGAWPWPREASTARLEHRLPLILRIVLFAQRHVPNLFIHLTPSSLKTLSVLLPLLCQYQADALNGHPSCLDEHVDCASSQVYIECRDRSAGISYQARLRWNMGIENVNVADLIRQDGECCPSAGMKLFLS